jgi:hypothetical protein
VEATVREGLAPNKQTRQRFNMEKFNFKQYSVSSNVPFWSTIGLQLWKLWMLKWILVVLGKRLEGISELQTESRLS